MVKVRFLKNQLLVFPKKKAILDDRQGWQVCLTFFLHQHYPDQVPTVEPTVNYIGSSQPGLSKLPTIFFGCIYRIMVGLNSIECQDKPHVFQGTLLPLYHLYIDE